MVTEACVAVFIVLPRVGRETGDPVHCIVALISMLKVIPQLLLPCPIATFTLGKQELAYSSKNTLPRVGNVVFHNVMCTLPWVCGCLGLLVTCLIFKDRIISFPVNWVPLSV